MNHPHHDWENSEQVRQRHQIALERVGTCFAIVLIIAIWTVGWVALP